MINLYDHLYMKIVVESTDDLNMNIKLAKLRILYKKHTVIAEIARIRRET